MKKITIGRSSSNDVNINDPSVSRSHCLIIQDDNGNFRLIDTNSKNGTFINGTKRHGEVRLNTSDIVRIGNTTLPWQTYFNNAGGTEYGGGRTVAGIRSSCSESGDINKITIGRSSSNDVNINDPLVSRLHCQIIQDNNGNFILIDTNSKNGTFINGTKRHGEVRLNTSDIVRIGNTTLPWQTYFNNADRTESVGGRTVADVGSYSEASSKGYRSSDDSLSCSELSNINNKSGLGTISLVVSLAGTALLIYVAIIIMRYSIFGFLSCEAYFYVSFALHVIACVLASIAEFNDYKDSNQASIAEWLSGSCIIIMIGFYLYLMYGDGLNPFK